jgi:hypothetical protein
MAHLSWLFVFTMLWCVPLLSRGIPDLSHDGMTHAHWQASFSDQLWNGEWYPRWLTDGNLGLGSPSFFFYPPIPSYASSFFRPVLAASDPNGWVQMGYGCVLAIFLSGAAAYFWLRSLVESTAALFGACVYIIAPYHLAIDGYVRGAVAELWAFVWLPFLLFCVAGIRRKCPWGPLWLAVAFALLAMTHLPTVMCFSPVMVASGLLPTGERGPVSTTLRVVGGMAVGLALAAIYMVPVLTDQSKVIASQYLNGVYDYRRYWLFPNSGVNPKFEVFLLFATFSTLVFSGLLFWVCMQVPSPVPERWSARFYFVVAIVGLVFMTQLSYPFWKYIPFLHDVMFPWRFGTLLVVSAAALSALAFKSLKGNRPFALLAILAAIIVSWMGCAAFSSWREYSSFRVAPLPSDNRELVRFRPDPCEFWPTTIVSGHRCEEDATARVNILQALLAGRQSKSAAVQGEVTGAGGSASILDWHPRKIILSVTASEPSQLTLIHFYYPGWQGYIDGSSEQIEMQPSPKDGFLRAKVPKGKYKLVIELIPGKAERIGLLISLCAVFILLVITAVDYGFALKHSLGGI